MTERKALYPGSFDPPTNGHKWVMEQVSEDFDSGIVAVGRNPDKVGRFPVSEREEMLREIAVEYPNLFITSFIGLYQVDFAEMMGAQTIVRGVRLPDNFVENDIRQVNASINHSIKTRILYPPMELQQVSSSMVMGLVGFEGWQDPVKKMVPETVFQRLEIRENEKEKMWLNERWNGLYKRLGAKGNPEVLFYDLYSKYNEPHRVYHGLSHLRMCLNELDLAKENVERPDELELKLWLHDGIYELSLPPGPTKPEHIDDEGKSAEYAREVIIEDMELSHDIADRVASAIPLTKHATQPRNKDDAFLLDIDLAIFGRSERLFDEYEEKIRQEFYWAEEELFRTTRKGVLERFRRPNRDYIYYTKFFRDRYEEQAQKNLERSVNKLELAAY